jgi:hypothetical protein
MSLSSDGPAPTGNPHRMGVGGVALCLRTSHSLRPQNLPAPRLWGGDA